MAIKRYQKSSIRPIAPDSIGAGMSTQTQAFGQVASTFDTMSRFLEKKAGEEAVRRGTEIVSTLGPDKVLSNLSKKGGPSNIEERQAYAVASKYAANQIETAARQEVSRLILEAQSNKTPLNQLRGQLEDVILGYSAGLEPVDPQEAMNLQISLGSIASVAESQYAQYEMERVNDIEKGHALIGLQSRIDEMNQIATMPDANRQELFQDRLQAIQEYMTTSNFDQVEIAKQVNQLQKDYIKNSTLADFARLTPGQKQEYVESIEGKAIQGLSVDETRILRNKLETDISTTSAGITSTKKIIRDGISDYGTMITGGNQLKTEDVTRIQALINTLPSEDVDRSLLQKKLDVLQVRGNVLDTVRSGNQNDVNKLISEVQNNGIPDVGGVGIDTAVEQDVLNDLKKKSSNMDTRLKQDPLSYANAVGVVQLDTLDVSGSVTELQESVTKRIQDAEIVATHFGVKPKYFTELESNRLSELFDSELVGDENQKLQLMGTIVQAFGNKSTQVFSELSKSNALYAHIGGLYAKGQVGIAKQAIRGDTILKGGFSPVGMTKTEIEDEYPDIFGTAFAMIPNQKQPILDIAKRIYVANADQDTATKKFDKDLYIMSLNLAIGMNKTTEKGGFGEVRDHQVILPTDMTAEEFEVFLQSDEVYEQFRQLNPSVDERSANQIFQRKTKGKRNLMFYKKFDIYPVAVGDAKYMMFLDEGDTPNYYTDKNGQPIIIDMKQYR